MSLARLGVVATAARSVVHVAPDEHGWATRTLRVSMQGAVLAGIAGWQAVMVAAVWAANVEPVAAVLLTSLHVVIAAGAIWARTTRRSAASIIIASYAVAILDWGMAEGLGSALTFVACWQVNLTTMAATFSLVGRTAAIIPSLAILLVPAGVLLANPELGPELPISIFVTQSCILIATRLGVRALLNFTGDADRESQRLAAEEQELTLRDVRRKELAEDARTLHDTAINTLGAIASAGSATDDLELVRLRCSRDLDVLSRFEGSTSMDPLRNAVSLLDLFHEPSVRIVRAGADDEALASIEAQLPMEAVRALVGAARELCVNASKHARVSEVTITVRADGEAVQLEVADEGIGFDAAGVHRRGLDSSVLARIAEAGGRLEVESALGAGTTATLTLPLPTSSAVPPTASRWRPDILAMSRSLQQRSAMFWAVGASAVGFAIELVNHPGQFTLMYPVLLVNLILAALAPSISAGPARRFVLPLLWLHALAAFVLSASTVDFGGGNPVPWQALAPTAPLVLLSWLASRRILVIALASYAATGLIVAPLLAPPGGDAPVIVIAAATAGIGFVLVWTRFQATLSSIGAQLADEQELTLQSELRSALADALQEKRSYWVRAGLEDALVELRAIASGEVDPTEAGTRAACAREEIYLRQLIQLSSSGVGLGGWFVEALNQARRQRVELRLRAGEVDLDDPNEARKLGEFILGCVTASNVGDTLSVTVFVTHLGVQCTVVGEPQQLRRAVEASRRRLDGHPAAPTFTDLGSQGLAEFTLTARGSAPSTPILEGTLA